MFMSPESKVIFERRSSANFSCDLGQLVLDDGAQHGLVAEDRLEAGDGLAQRRPCSVSRSMRARRVSWPSAHVEDVLGLDLGELEGRGREPDPGGGAVVGAPDQRR